MARNSQYIKIHSTNWEFSLIMNALELCNPGRTPQPRLVRRQKIRICGIMHFGLNTFTGREWGYGDESPELFNPVAFDADQIAEGCKQGGLDGLIIVCKHHDGFCLWPTRTTEHSIAGSPWRKGKGDLVGEMVAACRRAGLAVGFYVSPWDRHDARYGTPEYVTEVFRPQLREILGSYGPAFEVWFDGANGGDGWYGGAREERRIDRSTYYGWAETWNLVRELQPDAAIFSDIGPDLRWVGNERGYAMPECRNCITPRVPAGCSGDPAPGFIDDSILGIGEVDGKFCIPPECDVPLRPGWFYHEEENDSLRSVAQLVEIYEHSVGNGGVLNLGIAPEPSGRLHEVDVQRLAKFKQALDSIRAGEFASAAIPVKNNEALLEFGSVRRFNRVELAEPEGDEEKITAYSVLARCGNSWREVVSGQSVGPCRIRRFPDVEADACKVVIRSAVAPLPELSVLAFCAPEFRFTAETQFQRGADYRRIEPVSVSETELLFELPEEMELHGFVFTPVPDEPAGTPSSCRFYADREGEWQCLAEAEFSNVRANPVPQVVRFPETRAKRLKFVAVKTLEPAPQLNVAEFGILSGL